MIIAVLAACQKELPMEPAISFFAAEPEIQAETAIFRLAFANITDSTERAFPVTFGGTAELGTDYTVSGDRFVFGGDNPVDKIIVNTLKLGTDKTLSLTVEVPEGYMAGKYTTSGYTLQDKLAYFSFSENHITTTDSVSIGFNAKDRYGRIMPLAADAEVSIKVNKEKSTAEEGVDFAFSDGSSLMIPAGRNNGSIGLKMINPNPQNGKDKIVLNFGVNEKYSSGEIAEIEISLLDTIWRHLDGKWVIDTLVTDAAYMEKYWNEVCTGFDKLPVFNSNDNVSIDIAEMEMTSSFISAFDDYFSIISHIRKGPGLTLDLGDGTSADLQTFMFDNINRYFSPYEKSEDEEAYIGFRFLSESADSLDMYIIDYESRSFMPELESLGKYAPEKPVAAAPGLFLNLTFKKQ